MKKYISLLIFLCMPIGLSARIDHNDHADIEDLAQVSAGAIDTQKSIDEPKNETDQGSTSQAAQSTAFDDNLVELDAIHAIVLTEHGKEIITQSDVLRSGLTGQQRPIDEIIFERLVYLDAKKHKIDIDEAAVERYLARVISENNLRPEDLKAIFAQEGFTLEEGKVHLQKMQTVSSMIDFKIRSNLIIPKKEIVKYYEENPVVEPAEYYIEIASVLFDPGMRRDAQQKNIYHSACGLTQVPILEWMEPFWIKAADLAEDKQFISSMHIGDVEIIKSSTAFEVYRVKEIKPEQIKTLDERYHEIADILRMPKYETLVTEYRDALFKSASIVKLA